MTVKINGTDGIDVAQLRAPDGTPVAMTIDNDGRIAFPAQGIGPILRAENTTGSAAISVPSGWASATMIFGTEVLDTENGYNPSTGEYTVQRTGLFFLNARLRYNVATGNNDREIDVNVTITGGSGFYSQVPHSVEYPKTTPINLFRTISGFIYATAGTVIKITAAAEYTGNTIGTGNQGNSVFHLTRLN